MTIDLGLLESARKAIAAKPRHFITPQVLLAVVMQESHGMPYFVDTKPGSQYKQNVYGATRPYTGLTEKDVRGAILLPAKIGDFEVPKTMQGQLAKFRLEPSYWHRYTPDKYPLLADKIMRFYFCSSWGMVQFMGPNISHEPTAEGIEFIRRFSADVGMQLVYGAGMIDGLLQANHGDVDAMYRAYNSGNPHSHDPAVIARAQSVTRSALEIGRFISTRNT